MLHTSFLYVCPCFFLSLHSNDLSHTLPHCEKLCSLYYPLKKLRKVRAGPWSIYQSPRIAGWKALDKDSLDNPDSSIMLLSASSLERTGDPLGIHWCGQGRGERETERGEREGVRKGGRERWRRERGRKRDLETLLSVCSVFLGFSI